MMKESFEAEIRLPAHGRREHGRRSGRGRAGARAARRARWRGGAAAPRRRRKRTLHEADADDAAVVPRGRALALPVATLRGGRTAHAPHADTTVVGACRWKAAAWATPGGASGPQASGLIRAQTAAAQVAPWGPGLLNGSSRVRTQPGLPRDSPRRPYRVVSGGTPRTRLRGSTKAAGAPKRGRGPSTLQQ